MHIGRLLISAFAFLSFFEPVVALRKQQILTTTTTTMSKTNDSSSVLRELKETIQKQKTEIDALKKQLKGDTKPTAATSHGGHGGGGEVSIDELASYLTLPFYRIALKRVGWLSLFLVSLSLTALIMNGFEHTLERQLELAYFVPLLAGHGGNTGGQAVGTVLSAISAGFVSAKDAPRIIMKEAMSGLLVGTILGCAIGPVVHSVMGISSHVSMVVACTLPLVSTIAATLGSAIPFLCLSFGLDPSVIAAPAMTSFVDVIGLMSYFLIANQIFALYGIAL
jgi:cation transporter-like permease